MPPSTAAAMSPSVTRAVLAEWLAEIVGKGIVAIDTETTSLDERCRRAGRRPICTGPGRAAYLPLGHVDGAADLFGSGRCRRGSCRWTGRWCC